MRRRRGQLLSERCSLFQLLLLFLAAASEIGYRLRFPLVLRVFSSRGARASQIALVLLLPGYRTPEVSLTTNSIHRRALDDAACFSGLVAVCKV